VLAASLLGAALISGCGSSAKRTAPVAESVPAYVAAPPTHQQQLVIQGAHLVVADGCSACHQLAAGRHSAPSFTRLAGHRVELADGRHVLVDEAFLRASLTDPSANALKGYDAALMVAATSRLHLSRHPRQVKALAAFIEEIGPEQD
jgi:cytochrome c5